MIYGLYLSATGVLTNTYRQDVIANNLANSESTGFKRDLAMFRERPTAAEERGTPRSQINQMLEHLGGGLLAMPTTVDVSQGDIEPTGNNMDTAIQGKGFFGIQSGGQTRLTRNGQFMLDRSGQLVMANDVGQAVLSQNQTPIKLDPTMTVTIDPNGTVNQNNEPKAKIGLFDVSDASKLKKEGKSLYSAPAASIAPDADSVVRSGYVERSNVDPATELTALMDTQRQLEANANMIRYQDQMTGELVGSVGKIS